MGAVKQLINWVDGGLNYDDDKRVFGQGDSDLRVNVSTDELGRSFVISNLKGTTEKSHAFSHDAAYSGASYTVIGSVYDDNRDAVYIALYSTLGNDSILRYNYSDDSFDKIAWDHTNLGFDVNYPLTDMYMLGDFLHWNPRTSSPRIINVQWAYWDHAAYERSPGVDANTWSVGDYVKDYGKVYKILVTGILRQDSLHDLPDTDVEFIDWCYCDVNTQPGSASYGDYVKYDPFYNTPRTPFFEAPYTAIEDDANYNANYIRGNIFQFAYRFYVPAMGYTISSTFSEIIADPNGESFNGEGIGAITTGNKIVAGVNLYGGAMSRAVINENRLWEFVEILFRKNNERQWRLADRIYHGDGDALLSFSSGGTTNYVIRTDFYNDRMYEVIDTAAIEKQYNALPVLAKAQWPLDGERSAYGGVTEGRDYIVPDVTLTNGNREIQLNYQTLPSTPDDTITWTSTYENGMYTWKSEAITSLPSGGTSPWTLRFSFLGQAYIGAYAGSSVTDYRNACLATVNQAPISAFVNATNQIEFTHIAGYAPTFYIYGSGTISGSFAITKVKSFKTNANHAFCLFYYDDPKRRSDPMAGTKTKIFVPSLPDEGTLTVGTNHQQYLDWEINHNAPSWAKYWRWGYAGNQSVELFWQYNIENIAAGTGGLSNYALVNISGLQTITDDSAGNDNVHVNSNIGSYVFEPGDKLRFITQHSGGTATDTTDIVLADSAYDYEIKGYDPVNYLIYIDVDAADGSPYTDYNGGQTVVEIYRPKQDPEDMEYYEIGPMYEVYEDGGKYYHRGATQDQTSSLPATGQHNSGDVYLISRQVANGPFSSAIDPIFVESYHWSDFYDSDSWGRGKLGIISGIGQKYMNNVRYGNKYSPKTLSSGLSEFDALDYKSLSNEHGNIVAMRQAGHVLKVYFERNSAGILVNKTQLVDADGVSQVVKSDNVLGSVDYSNYHYGTIFPESVFLIDRTVYFYDIYRKSYVRDASNGLFAISDYKAVSKFVDISDKLLTSGVTNVQVWTGYDPIRKFVYIQFKDSATPANDEVIVFNEKKNRWECTVEITDADLLRSTSRDLISFIGEDLYIHNDNVNRGYFYTGYAPMRLNVIMNESQEFMKILDSISLNTNDKTWEITAIEIPPSAQYPKGQSSKIPNAVFTGREGGMHSEFLRNMKTSSTSESLLELREGEELRGQTATITLQNAATTEVVLFDVVINMTPSKI